MGNSKRLLVASSEQPSRRGHHGDALFRVVGAGAQVSMSAHQTPDEVDVEREEMVCTR